MSQTDTTTEKTLPSSLPIRQFFGIGNLINSLGLPLADCASFFLIGYLIRHSENTPSLIAYTGLSGANGSVFISLYSAIAVLFILARYLSGDYGPRKLFWDGAKGTTTALLVASLPEVFIISIKPDLYSVWQIILTWTLLIFLVPLMRQAMRALLRQAGTWQIPTAIIGVNDRTKNISELLEKTLSLGLQIQWLVTDDKSISALENMSHLKKLYHEEPAYIASTLKNEGCGHVIFITSDIQTTYYQDLVRALLEVQITVAIAPPENRLPTPNSTIDYFFGHDTLLIQIRPNSQNLFFRVLKRLFDIVFSTVLLIVLSPALLAFAVIIKLSDPGPIIFSHKRVGRNGVPFRCLKFRTMVNDAEEILKKWENDKPELYAEFLQTYKLSEDPRITRIGLWLRKTSLDELPQLWNVLYGEMSLVGPRPVLQEELDQYYGLASKVYIRLRPGMTGLWQISGRSNTSYERRVLLDEWYVLNWSFWTDIVILLQTFWVVALKKGAF